MNILTTIILSFLLAESIIGQTTNERVKGDTFDGIILRHAISSWDPTSNIIRSLEHQLPAYLDSTLYDKSKLNVRKLNIHDLIEYKRQYFGIIKDSVQVVEIQLIHQSTDEVKSGKWLERNALVVVDDDGPESFVVEYDWTNHKFLGFTLSVSP